MNTTQKRPVSAAALRKKLFSAAAMLLVASIMLVSTSYAWLVLSTAPEITGISTQVGANGALEIVLLNTESYNDLSKVVEMDIDESLGNAVPAVTTSNLSWGNLIGLGDERYGLDQITLNPSRLNIAPDGDAYKINSVLLKTPVYNEDGRIIALEQTAVTSVYDAGKFPASGEENYGVRAIGVAADMNEAQLGINAARATLATNMAAARTTASRTLNAQGNALGNVAIGVALGSASGFGVEDVTAMRDLAVGLQTAMGNIDTAIRQVYLAHVYSLGLSDEAQAAAITEINEALSLATIKAKYTAVTMPAATGGGDIVDLLVADQVKVQNAIDACNTKINSGQTTFSEAEILAVMQPLVNYNDMTMGGYTMTQLQEMMAKDDLGALMNIVMSGGLTVNVPTGSGILSDIADFAGNYTAEVTVENITVAGFPTIETATANMATVTTVNPVYLTQCSNMMRGFTVADGGSAGTVITDYYGYAIDLAFRTNASGDNAEGTTDLQLQTESTQRIYDESNNVATQGGGSYMTFNSDLSGLSATKMIKLMSGIRVVFMDQEQQVLAIAALDTTLGQGAYATGASTYTAKSSLLVGETTVTPATDGASYVAEITKEAYDALEDITKPAEGNTGKYVLGKDAYTAKDGANIPAGKYAVLNYDNPQKSDYITKTEYDALAGKETAVSVAADGSVTAKLYLYDFTMPMSEVNPTEPTGAIALGAKRTSAAITALEENVPKQVTALVYLDGSVVNNSMVAANSSYSMTGVMNLQFSSSANLVPMNNQALFDGEEEATPST